jgi:hypothetical protein
LKVFYDEYEQATTWGRDLSVYFQEVFYSQSRWCIILISKAYVSKKWPAFEAQHAIARQIEQFGNYILPVTFDKTEIPGLPTQIGREDGLKKSPEQIAKIFFEKFEKET